MDWRLDAKVASANAKLTDREILWVDWDQAKVLIETGLAITILYEGACFAVVAGRSRERALRTLG